MEDVAERARPPGPGQTSHREEIQGACASDNPTGLPRTLEDSRAGLRESTTTHHSRLTRQLPPQHLEAIAELLVDAERRGGFVAAVHHAMLAARVVTVAVLL